MAPEENNRKSGDVADSSIELVHSDEKNPQPLNPKQETVNKSSTQEFVQSLEAETSSKVRTENGNKRKRKQEGKQDSTGKREAETHLNLYERKNERKVNDETEEMNRRNQKSDKRISGMIFMCNAKTKPDCFRYRIMGVSTSRQELVMSIKPGLKLFLFDFDLKLMYGIYEASSNGGMKLEPRAFSGAFPAQVRFKILKDCLPLPEGIFKKAIKENYDEKTHKFKTQLNFEQVNRLMELFRPAPWLHSNAKPSVQELVPAPVVQAPPASTLSREDTLSERHYGEQSSKPHQSSIPFDHDDHHMTPIAAHFQHPLFLTEREYRSYGLRSGRHLLPTAASSCIPSGNKFDNYRADHVKGQLPSNLCSADVNAAMVQKETGRPDLFFLSEKEYRTYGLKGCQESHTRITPTSEANRPFEDSIKDVCNPFEDSIKDVCNPYDDSTTSLVNRYLSLPRTGSIPAESYYLTERGTYTNNSSYIHERRDHLRRVNPDGGRPYSSYASDSFSDYNQHYHRLGDEPNFTSTKVSSRYSFAGPSMSQC